MNLPDKFKDYTVQELCEHRDEILSRPFPTGWSGDERHMMDALEQHCTNNFLKALEALKEDQSQFYAIAETENCGMAGDRAEDLQKIIKKLESIE